MAEQKVEQERLDNGDLKITWTKSTETKEEKWTETVHRDGSKDFGHSVKWSEPK